VVVTAAVFSHEAPEVGERVDVVVSGRVMTYPSAQPESVDRVDEASNRTGSIEQVAAEPRSVAHHARDGGRIDPA
jgi:hypothetical protein